jgi:6-pyruvoyltetrahydropterin/6-carboxytetrahydropterin synthase
MSTVIEIGGGEFAFCAAHTGLHEDGFEPLHGHTFLVTVRLAGRRDHAGMVADFGQLKTALREAIRPLRRRTLIATRTDRATVKSAGGQVRVSDGLRTFEVPVSDVALLPVPNTTTEEIAGWLLDQVVDQLRERSGLEWAELTVAEAPDTAATVRRDLR